MHSSALYVAALGISSAALVAVMLIPLYSSGSNGPASPTRDNAATAKLDENVSSDNPHDKSVCSAEQQPCNEGHFCIFHGVNNTGQADDEYCAPCPVDANGDPDPLGCYFNDIATNSTKNSALIRNVESCAESCGVDAYLQTGLSCKVCPTKDDLFRFDTQNGNDTCSFCPNDEIQNPDRKIIRLFGSFTCSQADSFFGRLPVSKNSKMCASSQELGRICGCADEGDTGSLNETQKNALVWMPRVAAVLSLLGSIFIMFDTQSTPKRRSKLINKILCNISIFDAMGSFAMAFTSLPIPKEFYKKGNKGNDATCKVQGFFIQMGTIACLLGVSLSVYYNLTIKHGYGDAKMKRQRIIYYLLIPPIVIGLVFACAGIPYYDNVRVWCNNSQPWWPEIPILLSIFYATIIMGDVVHSVRKQERASSRYTGGSNKLSKMVFIQGLCFVGAFYITWIPYLVLQYLLSSNNGEAMYGLTLASSTMCSLQGWWNFAVYARPRYFNRNGLSVFESNVRSVFCCFSRKPNTKKSKSASQNETHTTMNTMTQTNSAPTTKIHIANSGSNEIKTKTTLQPEVIPFGSPDPTYGDEPDSIIAFGEPDVAEATSALESIRNIENSPPEPVEDHSKHRWTIMLGMGKHFSTRITKTRRHSTGVACSNPGSNKHGVSDSDDESDKFEMMFAG